MSAQTPADKIRIAIVDDHAMFREGLARSFEGEPDLEIVGQYSTASAAVAALAQNPADVVLLDVDLGAERALDFVSAAKQRGLAGRILVVTAGASDQEAIQLIQTGVAGILHKHHSTAELCGAIRQIAGGEVCLEKNYLGPLFRTVDRS